MMQVALLHALGFELGLQVGDVPSTQVVGVMWLVMRAAGSGHHP
jgi:hypothetical protein